MSNAIQTTQSQAVEPKSVKGWLTGDYFKKQVALCLPKHLTPERFCRMALSSLTRVPKLAECTPESVMKCMLTLSELGLEPDGRRAHLIPFKDNKANRTDCTLIVDYKGLAELAQRSGTISNIHSDVVCENDIFEYDRGELKTHRIDFRKPRGRRYAAYALIRFKDGGEKCEVMSQEEIEAVRDKSHGWRAFKAGYAKQNPWADDQSQPEMWKKTVFRRASKWLVLSPEIAEAMEKVEDRDIDMRNVTPESPEGFQFNAPAIPETTGPTTPIPAPSEQSTPMRRKNRLDNSPATPPTPPKPAPEAAPGPEGEPGATFEGAAEPELMPPTQEPAGQTGAPETMTRGQKVLADFCAAGGFSFDVFQRFTHESGNLPEAMSYAGFHEVPDKDCGRLMRSPNGLTNQMSLTKRAMGL